MTKVYLYNPRLKYQDNKLHFDIKTKKFLKNHLKEFFQTEPYINDN